jgi:hypothetical protein
MVRSEDDQRFASSSLKLWQPALWAPLPLILFALGIAASLLPGWRPGLLPGTSVVLLIVASAALNGPPERYRYPMDPAIAVLMSGGVVATATLAWRAYDRLVGARTETVERGGGATQASDQPPSTTDALPAGARFVAPSGS